MKIIFLGTNGWYDTQTGNTICTLIDSREGYIILDAGDGVYKAKDYLSKEKPIYIFLSHLHLDHISGFHMIPSLIGKNAKNIQIILEKGNKDLLNNIVRHPYMVPLGEDVVFYEVENGSHDFPFKFESLSLKHSDPTMGYRLYLEDKIISYCLDTGICDNFLKLSENSDVLITECSMLPGVSNQEWGHLNSKEAAEMAEKARVKKMVMTHISIDHKNIKERKRSEKIAQRFFKNSLIAEDNLVIEL